jgi:hypothetical protein
MQVHTAEEVRQEHDTATVEDSMAALTKLAWICY